MFLSFLGLFFGLVCFVYFGRTLFYILKIGFGVWILECIVSGGFFIYFEDRFLGIVVIEFRDIFVK